MGGNSNTYSVSSAAHEKPSKDNATAANMKKKSSEATGKTGASKKKKKAN
jgi:hypothetical protein